MQPLKSFFRADETNQPLTHFLFFFQFKATLKTYSYHILYSGTDLIADIGGYMGLFLGMSVFGIISLFSQLIHEEKPKKVLNLAKQTSIIVRESMIVRDNVKQTQEEMGKVQKIILANNTKLKSTSNNNKKTNLESTNL